MGGTEVGSQIGCSEVLVRRREEGERLQKQRCFCTGTSNYDLFLLVLLLINILIPALYALWTACHLIIFHWMEKL